MTSKRSFPNGEGYLPRRYHDRDDPGESPACQTPRVPRLGFPLDSRTQLHCGELTTMPGNPQSFPARAWNNPTAMAPLTFVCGYCGDKVGGREGWVSAVHTIANGQARIYICPSCTWPTFTIVDVPPGSNGNLIEQHPSPAYGEDVSEVPPDVLAVYDEARRCFKVAAFSATTMLCRKLLMNVAAKQGANPGESFVKYIDYLEKNGYIAPTNRGWIDEIRKVGNEANHELPPSSKEDAQAMLEFSEMLLKTVYEYPARAARKSTGGATP